MKALEFSSAPISKWIPKKKFIKTVRNVLKWLNYYFKSNSKGAVE